MSMPAQKPGRSRQDYGTPDDFLKAVKSKLGIDSFWLDLAASKENSVGLDFYSKEDDALSPKNEWGNGYGSWSWLNPPFANITPWAMKAYVEACKGAKIAMLVPASVGSNWWRDWVDNAAHVLLLNGRLTFKGESTPYPKDCALLLYNRTYQGGYAVWNWRLELEYDHNGAHVE